jgi:glutaredoxin
MITIYSKPACPYCDAAANFLETKNIPFTKVNIVEDDAAMELMRNKGHRTVPQIYYGDEILVEGGYTGLSKLTKEQINEKIEGIDASKQV